MKSVDIKMARHTQHYHDFQRIKDPVSSTIIYTDSVCLEVCQAEGIREHMVCCTLPFPQDGQAAPGPRLRADPCPTRQPKLGAASAQ